MKVVEKSYNKDIYILQSIGACKEGIDWAVGYRNLEEMWSNCRRGDWMMWYASRIKIDIKLLFTIACEIVKDVLHVFELNFPLDCNPRNCIKSVESWINGDSTISEVQQQSIICELSTITSTGANYCVAAACRDLAKLDISSLYGIISFAILASGTKEISQEKYANIFRKYIPQCPLVLKENTNG